MGRRDTETLNKLYGRLGKDFDPEVFCSDDYAVYPRVLPKEKHAIGKENTDAVERHNSNTRHWLARFRRKSKVVSKSTEMVRKSLLLVEHIFFGGGLAELTFKFLPILY